MTIHTVAEAVGHPGERHTALTRHGERRGMATEKFEHRRRRVAGNATVLFDRALRKVGREAELFVFEAMAQGHWLSVQRPEAPETISIMARFCERGLYVSLAEERG